MSSISRADLLKLGAGTAATAGLGGTVTTAAEALGPHGLNDIDHFVILMQENRSFDHYFGMLRGVRGFGDPTAKKLAASGRSVFYQPDMTNDDGYILPFHLDTEKTSAQQLADLSHQWDAQHGSLNGGAMDAWVSSHRISDKENGVLTMGYLTRNDLPFYYALADAFTICDAYHCSVLGPTYPNRLFSMTGSIDAAGLHGGPALDNGAIKNKTIYTWETYPERLERAGISWQIAYDVVDDYLMNIVRFFPPYRTPARATRLYQRARRGRPLASFLADCRSGNLPQVTWLLARSEQTEHPRYMPAAGEDYVHTILEALWANPKAWARTAFILMYDENDGQFDHVVPPLPDPGTPGEFVNGRPVGLGYRVPCLVISPYSRGGYVCSETFDHSSVLRLLEKRFGVEVPNLTPWRRATCGDLTRAFDFSAPPRLDVPELPETALRLQAVYEAVPGLPKPDVPKTQSMPVQEPGTRPRRA